MYVVTGATGNTGRVAAEQLLAAGKPVRAVGRRAERLREFGAKGAETAVAAVDDRAALARAFAGARAVYTLTPPDYTAADYAALQQRIGAAVAGAARDARVPYLVHLSSFGAQNRSGAGPVSGLGRQEDELAAVPGLNVLHLRPGFFMENLYGFVDMIRDGFIASPLRPDVQFPWIATRDVGSAAASAMLALDFEGQKTRELHGQRDLTWDEVARIVGEATGKPGLRYVRASYEDAGKGLAAMGMSPSVVNGILEMYRAIDAGRMRSLEARSARNTTPTSIEEFAKGLAAAVAARS
jgi:uncharacterized protein YbjT (DUF2867 family)